MEGHFLVTDKTAREEFLKIIKENEEGTTRLLEEAMDMCDTTSGESNPMVVLMCALVKNLTSLNSQLAYIRLDGLKWRHQE